ncbi:cytosol aminopeptidase-like [Strongylocentrotus purpuratus]|uniref:Cytosol aminopeptidase n=1 Tax=Strongylocentrotus purpuratus TaxID=7668 RepID=A0A7M7NTG4_STRPU|nr:cytosol aminopeptidase-like [Strongylocentrotus purpuratus]
MAASMRLCRRLILHSRYHSLNGQRWGRFYSSIVNAESGVVVGVYEDEASDGVIFTPEATKVNERTQGQLGEHVNRYCQNLKKGKGRVFYGLNEELSKIAVVSLGKQSAGVNDLEGVDEGRENIRTAVATGVRQLRDAGCKTVIVDPCSDAEAAAEGSLLSVFEYDELKAESSRKPKVNISLLNEDNSSEYHDGWRRGETLANAQNFARTLMEMPANKLTPTSFSEIAHNKRQRTDLPITIQAHSRKWAADKKMGAFLSVAKGSDEPPIFMDVRYNGAPQGVDPLVLIGKGVTFDSGGISIKPAAGMDLMRGDMGGAANVLAAMFAMASLELPVNVVGLIPLCENMVNGSAVRPGDVVTAMNGKTIQVDNTDAEGRLLLADALCYATTSFKPTVVIDLATLTGAIDVALGSAATGVFTNSQQVWDMLQQASVSTGDRVWRMPLFNHYTKQVTEAHLADVSNIGKYSRSGGSCTAAAFLREFVTDNTKWAHLDIAGVMQNKDEIPYLGKGMSGRPVRTLVDFVSRFTSV